MRARNAAVVDLTEFRRRKEQEQQAQAQPTAPQPITLPFVWVPAVTWVCWVPVWTPR